DANRIARMGTRALVVAFVFLCLSGLVGAVLGPIVFSRLTIDPVAIAALRARAAGTLTSGANQEPAGLARWLTDLIPPNPVRAAADGAMLPLIVFAVFFGLALLSIDAEHREPVVRFFRGVG